MFNLLKRKKYEICAPVQGLCKDIAEANDLTFSKKMLGDGFMIEPAEGLICSPCNGKLTMIFPTLHAFGLVMNDNQEIIVHIGIETVSLNGDGFEKLAKIGDSVKIGEPIIKVDTNYIKSRGYDASVMVILSRCKHTSKKHINEMVNMGDVIVESEAIHEDC